MTTINFQFDRYPAYVQVDVIFLTGVATITAKGRMEVPALPDLEQYWKRGAREIRPKPLQEPLAWDIESVRFFDARGTIFRTEMFDADVRRFIRGKYWPVIPARLYTQFLKDKGLADRANIYARISGATEGGWREAA